DLAPLGRDRGYLRGGPGGGDGGRTDQDRLPLALGPGGEVQPAAPHRGVARRGRTMAGPGLCRRRRGSDLMPATPMPGGRVSAGTRGGGWLAGVGLAVLVAAAVFGDRGVVQLWRLRTEVQTLHQE